MTAIVTRFDLNRRNVATFAIGPSVHSLVRRHAQAAKTYAETLAEEAVDVDPKHLDDPDHQHYHESFELRFGVVIGITRDWPMLRAAARLTNTAPHARFVEDGFRYKTRDGKWHTVPGKHILGQTLDYLESFDERVELLDELISDGESPFGTSDLSMDEPW